MSDIPEKLPLSEVLSPIHIFMIGLVTSILVLGTIGFFILLVMVL